jgi:transposase InsO family protein
MDERVQFIADYLRGGCTMVQLCARYNVSRPTAYKWVTRYAAEGPVGLQDRSRRPHTSPGTTAPDVVQALIALRQRHPDWGARTLIGQLRLRAPDRPWPAPSTAAGWLKRAGLIARRRRRPRPGGAVLPRTEMARPNAVWTIDFKGQFRTRDGAWCYPLTLMDGCTRYLLACQALAHPRGALVRPALVRAFEEYGIPERIRSDNGAPFASPCALARLSPLAVWWIKLGIVLERSRPGRPADNGRHERMHRTLKRATAHPPAGSRPAQQRRFNVFRTEYNDERPHLALGGLPPAMLYAPSPRRLPAVLPELHYPAHFDQRHVRCDGSMKFHNRAVSVSIVLAGEEVGLEEVADGEWDVYFGPVRLGTCDLRLGRIRPLSHALSGHAPVTPLTRDVDTCKPCPRSDL